MIIEIKFFTAFNRYYFRTLYNKFQVLLIAIENDVDPTANSGGTSTIRMNSYATIIQPNTTGTEILWIK